MARSITFFATMGTQLTLIGLWAVPHLVVVYDMDVTAAYYYTMLGSVGILVGTPAVGRFSDAIGRRVLPMVVSLGCFAVALAVVPIFGRPPLAAITASYFLFGGAMLGFTIVKEHYPPGASGVARAVVNTADFLGGALFPTVMGAALDIYSTDETVAGTTAYTEFGSGSPSASSPPSWPSGSSARCGWPSGSAGGRPSC